MALQKATFAAGCFWGTEKFFQKEFGKGITEAILTWEDARSRLRGRPPIAAADARCRRQSIMVGYTGGHTQNPTYREVCSGTTGHAEALLFEYKPDLVKYEDLVHFFFKFHDPTTPNRQGNDVGTQYRSAIFYHTPEQKVIAERVIPEAQKNWKRKIMTEISPATVFWPAEEYHQQYLEKNPGGYCNHYSRY
ncbi:peptide methionine sulfoxide reductase [Hyaloraphidium curvatum]|nr:peptide methionine sulfoxide reductase [Hyaloraphidium curvatum]